MKIVQRGDAGLLREVITHRDRIDVFRHDIERHFEGIAQQAPSAPDDDGINREANSATE